MIPAERQLFISDEVRRRGVLSIAELALQLGVSQMTVRRDISKLEREGKVLTVSGGVQAQDRLLAEPSRTEKVKLNHEKKVALGRAAARLIGPDAVIYLDAGTTTLEIARNILDIPSLVVVTNDFGICALLATASGCEVHHTGGKVDRKNQSSVGEGAARGIRRFNYDFAFLSTSSWSLDGISTPDEEKTVVKEVAADCAKATVLVTDSSKFGKIGAFRSLPLTEMAAIITDADLAPQSCDSIRQMGVELILTPYDRKES